MNVYYFAYPKPDVEDITGQLISNFSGSVWNFHVEKNMYDIQHIRIIFIFEKQKTLTELFNNFAYIL